MFDRKHGPKPPHQAEKRAMRVSEIQPQQFLQLQEELRRARDEKTKALEDLEELRSNKKLSALSNKEELEALEKKVEKAKDSERNMLESLMSQTKQLEQTKILLEEAKLEIETLKDSIHSLEQETAASRGSHENVDMENVPTELIQAREEIAVLRNELRLAMQAEEESKKAMDDLAIALKEVTTEANEVKTKLALVESEDGQSKTSVKITSGKTQAKVKESKTFKLDAEDYVAVWKEKEKGLISCLKAEEVEVNHLNLENDKLVEMLRGSREETSKLRDIVKQAVNESNVVKEALEIVRAENSQLKDLLTEKENSLQRIRQEYESLKVSEAAAVDSVKELKGFLAATSLDSTGQSFLSDMSESESTVKIPSDRLWTDHLSESESTVKIPSEHLWTDNLSDCETSVKIPSCKVKIPRHSRRHSVAGFPGKSKSFVFGNRASSFADPDDGVMDFDPSIGLHFENGSPNMHKKRRPMLRKFGEMLRRKSFQK